MGQAVEKDLSAKDAVNAAFSHFRDLVDQSSLERVLLEGIEYHENDSEWLVTIGYDLGRTKTTLPSPTAHIFGKSSEKDPIREKRNLWISAVDSTLVRMN